jgi:hypothetical protein
MSDKSVHESVGVGIATVQPAEMAAGPSELDPDYYGWRVVLAACLGVMVGFGAIRLYLLGFCEAAGCGIRLESRSPVILGCALMRLAPIPPC